MKERPILFSAPMVKALLDGRKTQTRRIVKPQPQPNGGVGLVPIRPYHTSTDRWNWVLAETGMGLGDTFACPYGTSGDQLWVRESWRAFEPQTRRFGGSSALASATMRVYANPPIQGESVIEYVADTDKPLSRARPSIHMPRWMSRITLEITGVRVERLLDITEADARAEGITDGGCLECGMPEPCGCSNPTPDARDAFIGLWDSIHGRNAHIDNPWVWCLSFKRLEQPK